jgi:hypothetical protein
MTPERSVPMNMKGTPSNRMLKNEIEKSCKLNVNQLITCHPQLRTGSVPGWDEDCE